MGSLFDDEEEVLLKPGSKFGIDSVTSLAEEITQVQMHEVDEDEASGEIVCRIMTYDLINFLS